MLDSHLTTPYTYEGKGRNLKLLGEHGKRQGKGLVRRSAGEDAPERVEDGKLQPFLIE
jgi:hypothetical protein